MTKLENAIRSLTKELDKKTYSFLNIAAFVIGLIIVLRLFGML